MNVKYLIMKNGLLCTEFELNKLFYLYNELKSENHVFYNFALCIFLLPINFRMNKIKNLWELQILFLFLLVSVCSMPTKFQTPEFLWIWSHHSTIHLFLPTKSFWSFSLKNFWLHHRNSFFNIFNKKRNLHIYMVKF